MALVLTVTDPDGNVHIYRLDPRSNGCCEVQLENGETIHVQRCIDLVTGDARYQVRSAMKDDYVSTVTVTIDPNTLPDESVLDVHLSSGTEITLGKSCLQD